MPNVPVSTKSPRVWVDYAITGLPGQGPVRVGIPIADLCAGMLCAQGIMIALLEREVSGKG